ncbi:hypothetical protein [Aquimarina hainanensis]
MVSWTISSFSRLGIEPILEKRSVISFNRQYLFPFLRGTQD